MRDLLEKLLEEFLKTAEAVLEIFTYFLIFFANRCFCLVLFPGDEKILEVITKASIIILFFDYIMRKIIVKYFIKRNPK